MESINLMETQQFVLRIQGTPYQYGVGERIIDNVYLFRVNEYNLTLSEAKALLARKVTPKKAH